MELYEVVGIDDYEGLIFAICSSEENAKKAKSVLEKSMQVEEEDSPLIIRKSLPLDTVVCDGKTENVDDNPAHTMLTEFCKHEAKYRLNNLITEEGAEKVGVALPPQDKIEEFADSMADCSKKWIDGQKLAEMTEEWVTENCGLTFRLYVEAKFNRPIGPNDLVTIDGVACRFNKAFDEIDVPFDETSCIHTSEPSTYVFEFKNPSYSESPRICLLTENDLSHACLYDLYFDWDCEDLELEKINEAAFVIVKDDVSESESPFSDELTVDVSDRKSVV